MEEQIFEILDKIEFSADNRYKTTYQRQWIMSKEITFHVMKFIEWLDFGSHDFYLNAEKDQMGYYQKGSHTIYTIEEVYNHWLTNVKK